MTFCDFVFGLSFICCHLIISESGILDHWGKFCGPQPAPQMFLVIPPRARSLRMERREASHLSADPRSDANDVATGRLITVATLPNAQSPYWNCAWRASGLQSLISGWSWGRSRLIHSSSSASRERHFRPHRKNCWERAGVAAKVNSPLKPRTDAQRFSPLASPACQPLEGDELLEASARRTWAPLQRHAAGDDSECAVNSRRRVHLHHWLHTCWTFIWFDLTV